MNKLFLLILFCLSFLHAQENYVLPILWREQNPHIVASYSESNKDYNSIHESSVDNSYIGQCFHGDGRILTSCKFYLSTYGSPSGMMNPTMYAYLYASTGTYGTDMKPTGSALATSTPLDISVVPTYTSFALEEFIFDGTFTLVAGTAYVIVIAYIGGDASNYLIVGADASSPSADGNYCINAGSWYADNSKDLCFYIYGTLK